MVRPDFAAVSQKLAPETTHVLLHDGARPLVPYSDIDALIEAAQTEAVAVLTTPVRSELIQVDDSGNPMHRWRADEFVHLLTPQVFTKERFVALGSKGEGFSLSHVKLIKGSPLNQRIRGAGDAGMAKAIMNLLPKPKIKPPSSPFEEAQW